MKTLSRLLMMLSVLVSASASARAQGAQQAATLQPNTSHAKLNLAPSAHTLFQGDPCTATDTAFCLGAPEDKATDQPFELTLGWTEPRKEVKEYVVQVSAEPAFSAPLINESVPPSKTVSGGEFSVKKSHGLKRNTMYFWRVEAVFADGSRAFAQNGVYRFTTTNDLFRNLSGKGFKLRKALAGPDAGELAEFSFLDTIGQKTVYSTTFAFSWQSKSKKRPKTEEGEMPKGGHTFVEWGTSVEGSLASDDSKTEDAWRFRGSAVLTTSFVRCQSGGSSCNAAQQTNPAINSLITYLSVKLESNRDFDVKKLSGEFQFTPNSRKLAIETARPELPKKPVQFQWRPFFTLDVGHTYRRGTSEEREATILRLVPRVRARLDLQFLRRALNLNSVAIFADDTFYHLPLEKQRKNNNFFTSGIEFNFTPNLGFGLTYKSGRSAPQFEKINTLQGIIGIRF